MLFFNEYLYRKIRVSNICYAYFMLTKGITEDYHQNDDDFSCVTVAAVITRISFITQDRIIDLP